MTFLTVRNSSQSSGIWEQKSREGNSEPIPLNGRLGLSAAHIVAAVYRFELWSTGLSRGEMFVTSKDLRHEIQAIEYIFLDEPYNTNCGGGRRGGCWRTQRLLRRPCIGAWYRSCSFLRTREGNFSLLCYTSDRFQAKGLAWTTHPSAVGSQDGSGILHVADASLGHSLVPRSSGLRQVRIPVASLSGILI